jgi:hypothetical protein
MKYRTTRANFTMAKNRSRPMRSDRVSQAGGDREGHGHDDVLPGPRMVSQLLQVPVPDVVRLALRPRSVDRLHRAARPSYFAVGIR